MDSAIEYIKSGYVKGTFNHFYNLTYMKGPLLNLNILHSIVTKWPTVSNHPIHFYIYSLVIANIPFLMSKQPILEAEGTPQTNLYSHMECL